MWGKKKILVLLLATLIPGCSTYEAEQPSTTTKPSTAAVSPISGGAKNQVMIYRSQWGKWKGSLFGILQTEEAVQDFTAAVRSGNKINGKLDISQPHYRAAIKSGKKETEIYLWLDNKKELSGLFTYAKDTGTGYRLTPETKNQLLNYIKGIRYSSEQATKNGDVTFMINEIKNVEGWFTFVDNVKLGRKGAVQLTAYTTEGDPIFYNLAYDEGTLHYQFDNTFDNWGAPLVEQNYCQAIEADEEVEGTVYTLTGCSDPNRSEQPLGLLFPHNKLN